MSEGNELTDRSLAKEGEAAADLPIVVEEAPTEDHIMEDYYDTDTNDTISNDPDPPGNDMPPFQYLDHGGDLKLRLLLNGADEEVYVVSSTRMQFASKNWHMVIQDLPRTHDNDGMLELSLLDDNGNAMLILACVVHGRFSQVSSAEAVGLIHELAFLCEKYDCVEVLMPFVAPWISVAFPRTSEDAAWKWIRTSWIFGCRNIFVTCLKYAIMNSHLDANGELCGTDGEKVSEYMPGECGTSTLDDIQHSRSTLLADMANECKNASKFSHWEEYGPCKEKSCSTLSFGYFIQQMQLLEDDLGTLVAEMGATTMSVHAFSMKILSLEGSIFPVEKEHDCKFDDFKDHIMQRLSKAEYNYPVEYDHKHFQEPIYTKYNHVLGSMLATTGVSPMDSEDRIVEEVDGKFRLNYLEHPEPSEEYKSNDEDGDSDDSSDESSDDSSDDSSDKIGNDAEAEA